MHAVNNFLLFYNELMLIKIKITNISVYIKTKLNPKR